MCIVGQYWGRISEYCVHLHIQIICRQGSLYTRWPVKDAKVVVFHKVKWSNLTHKGDDFCGIFAFYNTYIKSAAILNIFRICQALINSWWTEFVVGYSFNFCIFCGPPCIPRVSTIDNQICRWVCFNVSFLRVFPIKEIAERIVIVSFVSWNGPTFIPNFRCNINGLETIEEKKINVHKKTDISS